VKARGRRAPDHEAGAVLILALLVLTAVSLIVLSLLGWVGTSLNASGVFGSERSVEYAATSAVELAIQNSRYTFSTAMENASPPVPCWTEPSSAPTTLTMNNPQVTIYVWCSMLWQPFSAQTRTITYSACLSTVTTDAATCAAAPLLQAVETYDDYPPGIGTPASGPISCNLTTFCGQSQTQDDWAWHPTVPSVTSVTPSSGPITGTSPVTITGNGFVNGATVNYVQETGPSPPSGPANVPTSTNGGAGVIASATVTPGSENCAGPGGTNCTITVSAPAVTSGTSSSNSYYYFVTVTTPGGTSAYVPTPGSTAYNTFQHSAVTPVVTGITEGSLTPGGTITGGTTITINGSGFFNVLPNVFSAQVWFCSATPCTGSAGTVAGNVSVTSGGSITATSPPVSAAGNYYVQVRTIGGTSTNTTDVFAYSVQVPIIISLSPSTGPAGTSVTITGANFLSGSTVSWYLDSGGSPTGGATNSSAASTTVNSAGTQITTVVPTLPTNNSPYFPVITLPAPYNTDPASQPYNEAGDIFNYTT